MSAAPGQPIPLVVQQHVEEAAILRNIRAVLVRAPHVKLHHLGRLDDRLAAHLDGLAVAGEFGRRLCESALANPGVGEVFAATVRAIEDKDSERLDKLLIVAEAVPESQRGLISAFGWISAGRLKGIVSAQLASSDRFRKCVGLAACSLHRADPGAVLETAIVSEEKLRARALRCAGELGRQDLLARCVQHQRDEEPACAFAAAWAATLLGNRDSSRASLIDLCAAPGPYRDGALQLALMILRPEDAHALLKAVAQEPADHATLIKGAGVAGNPSFVDWLISEMKDDKSARGAGRVV